MKARIYYRNDPVEVVLQKDGKDVLSYKSVDDLVETHIKGLLAVHEQDEKAVLDLLRKYRTPSDINNS